MYYKFNDKELPHISHMSLYNSCGLYTHPRRIPGEYIMLFVKSGTLMIRENATDYCLGQGDVLLLDPDSVHEGTGPCADAHYYIHMAPSVFRPFELPDGQSITQLLGRNRDLNNSISPFSQEMYEKSQLILPKYMSIKDLKVRNRFELAMEQAMFATAHRQEYYKLICSTCFMQILTELAAYFSANALSIAHEGFSKSQQKVLTQLTEYLHKFYDTKLTSVDLENKFGMNFDYLNRLFKKKNGMPIFTYLNAIRIDRSVEILVSGNTKLYEIARAVGYGDEYYFSKVFKKQLGVSPKNYLKLYQ